MSDGKSQRSRSTCEAGEPTRGTLGREGERRTTEPLGGKTMETPISGTVSTKRQRIADLARETFSPRGCAMIGTASGVYWSVILCPGR